MNRFHNKRNHITFTASVIRTNNTFFLCFSFNLFSNFPSQCILFRDWNCIGKRQKKIIRNSEEIYVNEHTCVVCFAYEEVNKQKKNACKNSYCKINNYKFCLYSFESAEIIFYIKYFVVLLFTSFDAWQYWTNGLITPAAEKIGETLLKQMREEISNSQARKTFVQTTKHYVMSMRRP